MGSLSQYSTANRLNVLALDGGGVRGLSSLLVLQDLMRHVNKAIADQRHGAETLAAVELEPRDVFDFVAGTSTGGLIAIMLGKLGMTLEGCIRAYHDLSKEIFGRKHRHLRGKITHGLAPTRYSGSHLEFCIRDLIRKQSINMAIPMVSNDRSDQIDCAVICREHENESKYSDIKQGAVPICSLPCENQVTCLVSEAARATSAAPTFFPIQKIGDRYFIDGGMEYNNPSHAIWCHYSGSDRVAKLMKSSSIPEVASSEVCHGGLNFEVVRVVNLGTGTKTTESSPRQRDRLAKLVPGFIRMTLFLKRILTEFAVNSETIAEAMDGLVAVTNGRVKYERFSADNGVCYIKMDKYKELDDIGELTSKYLQKDVVQCRLREVGGEIARDYLSKQEPIPVINTVAAPTSLSVPDPNAPSSQIHPSPTSESSKPGSSAAASMSNFYEVSDNDTRNDGDASTQPRHIRFSPKWDMLSGTGPKQMPSDTMTQTAETVTQSIILDEC